MTYPDNSPILTPRDEKLLQHEADANFRNQVEKQLLETYGFIPPTDTELDDEMRDNEFVKKYNITREQMWQALLNQAREQETELKRMNQRIAKALEAEPGKNALDILKETDESGNDVNYWIFYSRARRLRLDARVQAAKPKRETLG